MRACAHGVHIINAKFKNDRAKANGDVGCMKMEKKCFLFPRRISTACISLLCYNTMSQLPTHTFRDTVNNILVQKSSSCYTFRIIILSPFVNSALSFIG